MFTIQNNKEESLAHYIFTLDTCIRGVSLAFIKLEKQTQARRLVWKKVISEEYASSSLIQKAWQEGLEFLNCSSSQMKAAVLATGPGSFTGIKVGLAWFLGLQEALGGQISILMNMMIKNHVHILLDRKDFKRVLCLSA